MKLKPGEAVYVRSMGKLLRVTAIFTSDDAANHHMAKSSNNDAVVAVFERGTTEPPLILLADVHDKGHPTLPWAV